MIQSAVCASFFQVAFYMSIVITDHTHDYCIDVIPHLQYENIDKEILTQS